MESPAPIRRLRRRHRPSAKRRFQLRLSLRAAAVALLLSFSVLAIHSLSSRGALPPTRSASPMSLQQMATASAESTTGLKKPARLVYQYSVVPGGVQNVSELSQAVAHDPDVAFHYASFNFRRAHLVRLPASQRMYISYRRNGKILWTKTPHLILAGEKVITDGKVTARTRCGNRLASKPEGLTAPDEPSEAQLNQPVAVAGDPVRPPTLLAQKSSFLPPLVANGPAGSGPIGIPIGIGPIIGGGGGSPCETEEQEKLEHDHDKNEPICPKKHHPPPTVPEPSTVLLMGSGILLLGYQYLTKRSRRLPS